jgi:hypothetical protein
MRARLTSLLLATACFAGVGCTSKLAEETSAAAAVDHGCATSSIAPRATDHDTAIDSILTQPTSDRRLAQINRSMYQSLRALDAELRREQSLAACQPHPLESAVLQARSNDSQAASGEAGGIGQRAKDAGAAGGVAVSGTAHATADGAIGTSAISASLPSNAADASGTAAAARGAATHKASPANGRGNNGVTAPKVLSGSDNDIVARRLRRAAEQETNPVLRAKLWKEYTDYRQGTSAK